MTKFAEKSFTVPFTSKEYSEGWERIFGKKHPPSEPVSAEVECFCPLVGRNSGEHTEDCVFCYISEWAEVRR